MTDALVIDDNRQTADALAEMLEMLGCPARVSYGASPAMAMLRGRTPSVILLDINMPGLDGTEVLAYLQREPRLKSVPVIVITSDDQPETRQRVMNGGAAAIVIKPATFELLEAALKKVGALT